MPKNEATSLAARKPLQQKKKFHNHAKPTRYGPKLMGRKFERRKAERVRLVKLSGKHR